MQIVEHLTDFLEVQYVISVVQALQFKLTKPDKCRNIFICKRKKKKITKIISQVEHKLVISAVSKLQEFWEDLMPFCL